MCTYFLLQLKRVGKLMISVGLVTVILFSGLLLVFNGIMQSFSDKDANTKLRIGVVGEAEDSYLDMGVAALQSIDSSRFAIEVLPMEENDARSELEAGNLAAYVVIPEGFTDAALEGRVLTIDYVTTVGSRGLVSMFKEEITTVISDIVLSCQRGMYGIEGALKPLNMKYGSHMNKLSRSYVELVLLRSATYELDELALRDKLGLEGNLFCGICIVLFALATLPFGQLLIKHDLSLDRLLASKRKGVMYCTTLEYFAFFVGFVLVILVSLRLSVFVLEIVGIDLGWLLGQFSVLKLLKLLPALLMISSFAFLIYGLSDNLVSGILIQFFVSVFMCFLGGCMYPVAFFPDALQMVARWLPHYAARNCVTELLSGVTQWGNVLVLLGCSAAFLSLSVVLRNFKMNRARG